MKKAILFIMLMLFTFNINVNATNTAYEEGQDGYSSLFTEYNKGLQTINVTGTQTITLYGYSECSSSGCDYTYSKTSSDYKAVLKKSIVCTNGEKYINVQTTSNSDIWYKNSSEYTGKAAWSEDFNITCTNTPSSSTEQLDTSAGQPTTQPTNNGGGYSSSGGTTTNESQGVGTYYIILGIVGIITYFLTILVKKQNLFKKV